MGGRKQGVGGREGGNKLRGREGGKEGGRGGGRGVREEPIRPCRERASLEEGRVEGWMVDGGNERGRDGTRERGEGGSERKTD